MAIAEDDWLVKMHDGRSCLPVGALREKCREHERRALDDRSLPSWMTHVYRLITSYTSLQSYTYPQTHPLRIGYSATADGEQQTRIELGNGGNQILNYNLT